MDDPSNIDAEGWRPWFCGLVTGAKVAGREDRVEASCLDVKRGQVENGILATWAQ